MLIRHRYLAPLLLGLLAAMIWKLRTVNVSRSGLQALTVIGLAALAIPALTLARFGLGLLMPPENVAGSLADCVVQEVEQPPDIYLIIMDAYERADVLSAVHGFDNTPFLDQLRGMGFTVADGAMSNYRFTVLSISTMLNMDYVQASPELYDPQGSNWWSFAARIPKNRLRRELACLGYATVAVDSGVPWTNWEDANYFFTPTPDPLQQLGILGGVSRDESLFLETTFARVVLDAIRQSGGQGLPEGLDPDVRHRELVLAAFDTLGRIPALPSPKLVYVHIVSPHPPMVFPVRGSESRAGAFNREFESNDDASLQAYADQVAYLNDRLIPVLERILQQSANPPIIVLTSDHGWAERDEEDKLSILHAYYLPGVTQEVVYPTITPVNAFRLILDTYFGAGLGLLPDRSYHSTLDHRFEFELIENTWSTTDAE
jgi:hypothetical protein